MTPPKSRMLVALAKLTGAGPMVKLACAAGVEFPFRVKVNVMVPAVAPVWNARSDWPPSNMAVVSPGEIGTVA